MHTYVQPKCPLINEWIKKIYIYIYAAAAAKSLQSCPALCDPKDGSPPGSAVPGILQAKVLEWVATAFSDILIYIMEYYSAIKMKCCHL